jgi:hypothetical protein
VSSSNGTASKVSTTTAPAPAPAPAATAAAASEGDEKEDKEDKEDEGPPRKQPRTFSVAVYMTYRIVKSQHWAMEEPPISTCGLKLWET